MATRSQQDTFMDDTDDCCPLCVEEFDLSDRSFRPCPCGYQVCQFCYNNIKNNMNGLCPACRRTYDDKNIQWKVISPEEAKADVAAQARKKAAARQKEAERRQVETLNRKHLAGLRVLQKNLVYVVGMNLGGTEDDVLQTLRGPHHFGQYGKIIKIVVSKAKENQPLGIYVTFASKDDAATCISALDGTVHDGRVLRAQYGTTKYCSAYLRNETCNNRNCMFLHETGEDGDSYSRQDLSSLNALSTQRGAYSHKSDSHPFPQAQAISQAPQSMAATSQTTAGPAAETDAMSRSDSAEGSALPTTANWAKNPHLEQSRRSSELANRLTPSPKASNSKLNTSRPGSRAAQNAAISRADAKGKYKQEAPYEEKVSNAIMQKKNTSVSMLRLEKAAREIMDYSYSWSLDRSLYDHATLNLIDNYPPLVDVNGGALRYAIKCKQEKERAKRDEEIKAQAISTSEEEENHASGSLQLGGEPDHNESELDILTQPSHGRRQFAAQSNSPHAFDNAASITNGFSNMLGGREIPHQQRNISLLKSNTQNMEPGLEQFLRGSSGNISQHQPQISNPFQAQNQQLSSLSRHGRQASRYTFANDSANTTPSVKSTLNSQLMAQQSGMMTASQQKVFASQPPLQPSLYTNSYSNIQGPPPGLKSSGTPPVSGGGMFGQGHGFASAMGGSINFGAGNAVGKSNNDDFIRDMMRGRTGGGNGGVSDTGKQNTADIADTSILQARMHHAGAGQGSYGSAQGQDPFVDHYQPQIVTPAAPPGLSLQSNFHPILAPSKDSLSPKEPRPSEQALGSAFPIVTPDRLKQPIEPKTQSHVESARGDYGAPSEDDDLQPYLLKGEADSQSNADSGVGEVSFHKDAEKNDRLEKVLKDGREAGQVNESNSKKTTVSKRPRPEKININDMKYKTLQGPELTNDASTASISETPNKGSMPPPTSNSVPPTPATARSQSSASSVSRQLRTLRLVPSAKMETLPGFQPSATAVSTLSPQERYRQHSTTPVDQPSTPGNEVISDNASYTSNSLSRPASPRHVGKIGDAPIRQKTKAQTKRDRQARAKSVEESKSVEELVSVTAEEAVQAPILGRKKKAKKSRAQADNQVMANSRAISPNRTKQARPGDSSTDRADSASLTTINDTISTLVPTDGAVETELGSPEQTNVDMGQTTKSAPQIAMTTTPATIITHLQRNGDLPRGLLDMFLSVPVNSGKFDSGDTVTSDPIGVVPELSEENLQSLERDDAIYVKMSSQEYAVVLPDRSVLRFLSSSEAARYLETRDRIAAADPSFLASARLPTVFSMNAGWDDCIHVGLSGMGAKRPLNANHDDVSQQFALSLLYEGDRSRSSDNPQHLRRGIDPSDLAAQMETMSTEDAEQALRSSELTVTLARKGVEAEEKKFNSILKKNRKLFKDWP